MINSEQANYLLSLAEPAKVVYDMDVPVSVFYPKKNGIVKVNYEEFKLNMGLDDIRLHWLTSYDIHMSGGAVMNWVWQEQTNEDIDFFFASEGAFSGFRSFISSYGFEEASGRGRTYGPANTPPYAALNNKDEGILVHLIGGNSWDIPDGAYSSFRVSPYGSPIQNIRRFDLRVCQFSVDCENIYMSKFGIIDLLTRRLVRNSEAKRKRGRFEGRIKKYRKKGFGESVKSEIPTSYMNTIRIGAYKGKITGKLKDCKCHVILITDIPFLSSKPTKKMGYPIRQNPLEWGAYYGHTNEIISKV